MAWLVKLKPVLNTNQLNRLSNIFDNAGQVFFGVVVLSPLIQGIDKVNPLVLTSGIVAVLICWITSILLMRKEKR